MGRLEVITGPMFSGKTEELIRRLRREQIAGKSVLVLRPEVDTRVEAEVIATHNGLEMPAIIVRNGSLTHPAEDYDVIGIDEMQFFSEVTAISDIDWLVQGLDKKIIVAGLDMNYRKEPFTVMPHLMAIADRVNKLTAICNTCGADAMYTQRLIGGTPAPFDGPEVLVGATESYEARCRQCYEYGG